MPVTTLFFFYLQGNKMRNILIIYHKDCLDGMAAAWIARQHFEFAKENNEIRTIDEITMHASFYEDEVPDLTGKEVYILDFSYPPEKLLPHVLGSAGITIIDHHDTAIEAWKHFEHNSPLGYKMNFVFNTMFSGAMLTWQHFKGNEEPPCYLKMCQDHDMWRFELPNTKAYVAGVFSTGKVNEPFDYYYVEHMFNPDHIDSYINHGRTILGERKKMVNNAIRRNLTFVSILGHDNIPCVNIIYDLASDTNEALRLLYPNAPFTLTYEDWGVKGYRKFSIRNDKNSPINVGEIAKKFGGGGRAGTGGFTIPMQKLIGSDYHGSPIVYFPLAITPNPYGDAKIMYNIMVNIVKEQAELVFDYTRNQVFPFRHDEHWYNPESHFGDVVSISLIGDKFYGNIEAHNHEHMHLMQIPVSNTFAEETIERLKKLKD